MIALLQRVAQAGVTVDGKTVGEVGRGLCILVCAVKGDTEEKARALAQKVLRYRIFEDDAGKMNRSVSDIVGQLLLVSQFTLAADTSRGNLRALRRRPPPRTESDSLTFLSRNVRLPG